MQTVIRNCGRLGMGKIHHFIEETLYQRTAERVFKRYIGARASLILAPALEMILADTIGIGFL